MGPGWELPLSFGHPSRVFQVESHPQHCGRLDGQQLHPWQGLGGGGNHTTQSIRTRGAQRLSRLKIVPVVLRNAWLNRETRCAYTPSARAWQDAVSPKSCKCAAELLYELAQAIHGLPKVAGDTCTGFPENLESWNSLDQVCQRGQASKELVSQPLAHSKSHTSGFIP